MFAMAVMALSAPTKCTQFYHSALAPSLELSNSGVLMPMLAFGTGSLAAGTAEGAVRRALVHGVTHIDTAYDYGDQRGVGRALTGVNRTRIFVTTKIPPLSNASTAFMQSTQAMQDDLRQLQLSYVDLMLLHNPPKGNTQFCAAMRESWRALMAFHAAGKTRAIGVSNFCPSSIECLLSGGDALQVVVPAINQVEYHLGMTSDPAGVKSYCDARGIYLQAYSPLDGGNPQLLKGELVSQIGRAHNVSGAAVSLRWVYEQCVPFITTSEQPRHLEDDLAVFLNVQAWPLTQADRAALDVATTPASRYSHRCTALTPSLRGEV